MSSTAISAQGTTLKLGASGSAKNITGATKAFPIKITSTAHGLLDGAVGVLGALGGMTQANGKVGCVRVIDANSFELPGINSTDFTSYSSGGTFTPTQVTVGNMVSYNQGGGQASDIDVTNFASEAKEFLTGLQDNGQLSFNLHVKSTDQGQQALLSSRAGSLLVAHELTRRDSTKLTFNATCKEFSEQGAVDQAVQASVTCRISGSITRT